MPPPPSPFHSHSLLPIHSCAFPGDPRRAFIWQNVLLGHLLLLLLLQPPGRMCSMCVKILFDYCMWAEGRGQGTSYCRATCRNIYFKYLFLVAGYEDAAAAAAAASCVYFDAQTVQAAPWPPPTPHSLPLPSPLHARIAFNYFSALDCTVGVSAT